MNKIVNRYSSLDNLKGIGEKNAKLFLKLEIETINDLLFYFPKEYETFLAPKNISEIEKGEMVAVYASVVGNITMKKVRNFVISNLTIKDKTGELAITFFNMPYIKNTLKNGKFYIFRGRIQEKGIIKFMEQPKIYSIEEYRDKLEYIQPKYGLTKGLSNNMIQKTIKQILSLIELPVEYYPSNLLKKYDLMNYSEAICQIHYPAKKQDLIKARKRLVFDEFFDFLFQLRINKNYTEKLVNNFPMLETAETFLFLEKLPYSLTKAQKKVWVEIQNDLNSHFCMNRLVQGDVGSGKTIIAILSLIMCVNNGYQGAFMAPTEVLASQHYDGILDMIDNYNLPLKPILLVGSMTAKEKRLAYEKIFSGEANIVIGTHALIQEKVVYSNLGLVITDEQHRFGVKQREILANKGNNPHVLVMSATPIPRTLAIIMYGDLQVSLIDELPANRKPIKNCVVNTKFRPKAYDFIKEEVEKGHQAYVICPMVEEGCMEELENVIEYSKKLEAVLPLNTRISFLHGKMKGPEKNKIMENFSNHEIDVLVSTTVIEVGINVPNATVIMIENAERFGLASLHQLRGRVGRGDAQSYCIFVSTKDNKETMERLEVLNKSNDGFFIASEDLKLRGPGDLFGVRQSGEFSFKMGDIYSDTNILKNALEAVDEFYDKVINRDDHEDQYNLLIEHIMEDNRNKVDFRTI